MIKVKIIDTPNVKVDIQGELFRENAIIQADWNETDETKDGYIKNKPEIKSEVIKDDDSLITSGGVHQAIEQVKAEAGVNFTTDKTLTLKDGVLSVNTTTEVQEDNTLPITSAAVASTVGNIEILLKTI